MREVAERLADIIECIDRIGRYVDEGRSRFDADELVQVWIIHHLEILGEASNGLPEEVRLRAPSIPWRDLIDLRNVLIHRYFSLSLNLVWMAAAQELPALRDAVEQLHQELVREEPSANDR